MSDRIQINYIYRNIRSGYYSIHKVFRPVEESLAVAHDVRHMETPCFRANPWSVLVNMLWMFFHRKRHVVFHVTGAFGYLVLPLWGCVTVLTVHDLSTLQIEGRKWKKAYLRKLWFTWPLCLATQITCISETTRRALLKEFPFLSDDKVTTIYNPLSPEYIYSPKQFNHDCPVVLHIGTTPNKNLQRVCRALNGISCRLVIVGKLSQQDICDLKDNNLDYINKVGISDVEMVQEYRNADIISFPSLYEGFGMPVIEGQATGRVVLTSRIEPIEEVSGGAVCYVNPQSVDDIRVGFLRIISDSPYREKLIAGGKQNVRRFEQTNIVSSYMNIYTSVLKEQ